MALVNEQYYEDLDSLIKCKWSILYELNLFLSLK